MAAPIQTHEQRFIERLRRHDERAFNELVEVYNERIYHLVFRMVGRQDEAEDLVQEVFVQVFKAIGTFRGDSKLGTWMYRIAMNLCHNRNKYLARRQSSRQEEWDQTAHGAADGAGLTTGENARPDHLVQGYQMEVFMRRAIRELPGEQREVLILRDIEGLAYEEVVEITGQPLGTVKSRIHRARSTLKETLRQMLREDEL